MKSGDGVGRGDSDFGIKRLDDGKKATVERELGSVQNLRCQTAQTDPF